MFLFLYSNEHYLINLFPIVPNFVSFSDYVLGFVNKKIVCLVVCFVSFKFITFVFELK